MRSALALASLLALGACQRGEAEQSRQYAAGTVVPAGERFTCTPIKLWDGDGPFLCAEGPRIRLAGIAAREHDETCRSNQPCPAASARAARDYLASLLGDPIGEDDTGHVLINNPLKLSCLSLGDGRGKRTAAWCVSPRVGDISCAMVKSGLALRWDRYWRGHRCQVYGLAVSVVEGRGMDKTDWRELAECCSASAAAHRDRWERARLLLDALVDDPGFEAVAKVFRLDPGDCGVSTSHDPYAEFRDEAVEAVGRAIRKILAAGGPDIPDPASAFSTLNRTAPLGGFPWFKAGEPVPTDALGWVAV